MKKTILFSLLAIFTIHLTAQKKDLMHGKFGGAALKSVLISRADWKPFPALNDRAGWAKADPAMLQAAIKAGENYINYVWPSIPATKSLLIERTGDRDEYQAMSFEKRRVLGALMIAEIAENKGRFIDPIINGVWSICEESWWGVPAHLPKTKDLSGLMDVSKPFVELFSAETATFLSWADYFFGEKFDAVSPQIRKRIYLETNKRIFEPLMTKPHGFMAASANGRPPNNWNPWICSNWLNAVLLLEKDEAKRQAAVDKILVVLDAFVNPYPQDGGCDEGPGYWGAAAASLFDNIAMLNLATNNSFQYVFEDEKIRNMGRFIYRAQISNKYFLNFADADPQPTMSAEMIYRFGKAIQDEDMMKFAAWYRQPATITMGFQYFRSLFALFIQDDFQRTEKGLPLPKSVWLPDIQVMVARDKQGSTDGFFLAAKGGHNDESHNHNDVGNYVVYYDGLPVLIDVGRGTYTLKTFSGKRYEIWYNCSDFHNLPTINGINQLPGRDFEAASVKQSDDGSTAILTEDLAKSFPATASINSWKRTMKLNRGKNVEISDVYSLKEAKSITQHLMTCYPAELASPGKLVIHSKNDTALAKDFVVKFDPKKMDVAVEKVKLETMEDKGIRSKWGDNIYRINFTVKTPKNADKIEFTVLPL